MDMWFYYIRPDCWYCPETGTTILAEDMPWELLPSRQEDLLLSMR